MTVEVDDMMRVRVGDLALKNPVMNASGILDETAGGMRTILENNSAVVVTKSVSLEPHQGNPMPVIYEAECGLINSMGLPNPGLEAMMEEISSIRPLAEDMDARIVMSVFGTPEEFETIASMNPEVDALELNLSCPHARGYGMELGTDYDTVKGIVREVRMRWKKPLWVKLTPNVTSIVEIARGAVDGGADALVAINTLKAIAIDADAMRPVLGNIVGGYSGKGIKPVALRAVWDLYEAFGSRVPVIGVGGITTGRDVAEFILAGATAVQIGTAFHHRGDNAIKEILWEFEQYLKGNNISVEELRGRARNV